MERNISRSNSDVPLPDYTDVKLFSKRRRAKEAQPRPKQQRLLLLGAPTVLHRADEEAGIPTRVVNIMKAWILLLDWGNSDATCVKVAIRSKGCPSIRISAERIFIKL